MMAVIGQRGGKQLQFLWNCLVFVLICVLCSTVPLCHVDQLSRCSLAVFCWGMTKEHHNEQFPLNPVQIPATRL